MAALHKRRLLCTAGLLLSVGAWSQTTVPDATPERTPGAVEPIPKGVRSEANVQTLVTQDDNVHVEELRVRGETKRILVQSRLGRNGKARAYEVLPADNGRDMSQGAAGKRDAAGQRVWNVLDF